MRDVPLWPSLLRILFLRYWTAASLSSVLLGGDSGLRSRTGLPSSQRGGHRSGSVVEACQSCRMRCLGLIAALYTDRWRRKPVLVWASVGVRSPLARPGPVAYCGLLQIFSLGCWGSRCCCSAHFPFSVRRDPVAASSPGTRADCRCQRAPDQKTPPLSLSDQQSRRSSGLWEPPWRSPRAISYLCLYSTQRDIRVDEPRP